jgi:hypothetical protein
MIKLRRKKWAGHIARTALEKHIFLSENLKGRDQAGHYGIGRRIILKLILEKQGVSM